MYRRLLSLSFLASTIISSVYAIRIPVRRENVSVREGSHSISVTKNSQSRRNLTGFFNVRNGRYVGNITISGESFEVILDTGSPDLWIALDSALPGSTNTSLAAEIDYGTDAAHSASIEGDVFLADVEFGGFSIPNQAYIDVANVSSSISTGLLTEGVSGLIGLSPFQQPSIIGTNLQEANYNASGYNALQNIFISNPDIPSQFTMFMTRNNGTETTDGGVFTIGDIAEEYSAIQDTSVLPIGSSIPKLAQHWSVHADAIIINGKSYNTSSSGTANLTAILDTGTPTAAIDSRFVDIMYGADAPTDGGFSIVPCSAQINVSLAFGGAVFPIHPIDMTVPYEYANGSLACMGTFGRLNFGADGTMLLGDTFLRNVYTLYNLGVGNANPIQSGPYVQMLSVTNATQAANEFAQLNDVRLKVFEETLLGGTNSSGSDDESDSDDAISGSIAGVPSTSTSSGNSYSALMRNSYIIIGLMGMAILLLLAIAILLLRRARESPKKSYRPIGADKSDNVPLQYESYNVTYTD